jgi:Ni,Fe-hydrogenase III small subunit/formate hydrogenlyase subunit 6/NADH:ubiquinone oxidoreductase subunit I
MISEIPVLNTIAARLQQGYRTFPFPETPPALPDRFRGRPVLEPGRCPTGCRECGEVCPTRAIHFENNHVRLDLGRCLFCPECERACPHGAIRFTQEYRLAVSARADLILDGSTQRLARALESKALSMFGRSLRLRQVSAGGCNACEADVQVLNTVVFDLSRFGIQFVASPRHADGLLVTGPVTRNMLTALRRTYEAVPAPKLVIAVGACAISGGPFVDHPEQHNGVTDLLPVDLWIPGCPPHPFTILDGLLRLLGRLEDRIEAANPAPSGNSGHLGDGSAAA